MELRASHGTIHAEGLMSGSSQLVLQWMELKVVGRKRAHRVTSIFLDKQAQELFENVQHRIHTMVCAVFTEISMLFHVADFPQVASC
jgi:hypothetical protein